MPSVILNDTIFKGTLSQKTKKDKAKKVDTDKVRYLEYNQKDFKHNL